ncbi:MAG: sodium ion-translocating decarboxylase subunit beta [Puniceicoccales bacterium]|nr:sodium ion-translocating decarboxylase subunit beta [Puniceicoccales bacterium]
MDKLNELYNLTGFPALFDNPSMLIMWGVVGVLFYLAVAKQYEPLLLIPIAFGALLANIPSENLLEEPAGAVISNYEGTVLATKLVRGQEFRVPVVTEEIAEHLSRFNDKEGVQKLFVRDAERAAKKDAKGKPAPEGIIGAIIRPAGIVPNAKDADGKIDPLTETFSVKFGTGEVQVCRADKVVPILATGGVYYTLPVGKTVVKGEKIAEMYNPHAGGLYHFIKLGVLLEIFPPLIFLGIGALTDFGPLIANPKTLLLGAAAQLGVFFTFITAVLLFGFTGPEAASIGIIGGADGPTSIFLSNKLAPHLMAAIAVAAYSYMALVPMIQPPIMRFLTTVEERKIRMSGLRKVGRTEKLVFASVVTVVCILLVPAVAPLIGMLMLGNFLRESGVTERLSKTAQNEVVNIVTIFLGTSVGITMTADRFLRTDTLAILCLGIVAFGFSTAGGVVMAKVMNLFLKQKINPLIGSAGVSAVPMAARVSQVEGQRADPSNFLLMHAMGPNVAGVIGSAIAAGFFISIFGGSH